MVVVVKVTNLLCDLEVKLLSNDYTNPNTNPRTLTMLTLTQTDPQDTFESFCAPVFCNFIRNYYCTVDGAIVTSNELILIHSLNIVSCQRVVNLLIKRGLLI